MRMGFSHCFQLIFKFDHATKTFVKNVTLENQKRSQKTNNCFIR